MSVEWNSISLAKAYLKYPKKRRVYSSLQVDYSFLFWSLFIPQSVSLPIL